MADTSTPNRVTRGVRGTRESATAQFRLLRLCRIIGSLLPDGPSADRVELRTIMGELQAELGNHPSRARDTDVAWESEDGEIPE